MQKWKLLPILHAPGVDAGPWSHPERSDGWGWRFRAPQARINKLRIMNQVNKNKNQSRFNWLVSTGSFQLVRFNWLVSTGGFLRGGGRRAAHWACCPSINPEQSVALMGGEQHPGARSRAYPGTLPRNHTPSHATPSPTSASIQHAYPTTPPKHNTIHPLSSMIEKTGQRPILPPQASVHSPGRMV